MRHNSTSTAQAPCLGGWLVMGLSGVVGILGVVMIDGPRTTQFVVLLASVIAIAISAFRLRTVITDSAAQRYKRYHRPLAGPRPGARLG